MRLTCRIVRGVGVSPMNKNEEKFMVTLTRQLINAGRTAKGAFNGAQYRAIGFTFGTPLDAIEGTVVTDDQYEKFLLYKDKKQVPRAPSVPVVDQLTNRKKSNRAKFYAFVKKWRNQFYEWRERFDFGYCPRIALLFF